MSRTDILKLYLVSVVVFFAIDLAWLGVIASDFYAEHLGFLAGSEHTGGQAPHLGELLIVGRDIPEVIDDQNTVSCGLERRTEQ